MKKAFTAAALALAAFAAACGSNTPPVPTAEQRCEQAPNPIECYKVATAGGDVNDYLLYGMAGYMLSDAINGSGRHQTIIVADPGYHGYRRPIPSYQTSRARFVTGPAKTTTIVKQTLADGSRQVTKTVTVSPAKRSWASKFTGSLKSTTAMTPPRITNTRSVSSFGGGVGRSASAPASFNSTRSSYSSPSSFSSRPSTSYSSPSRSFSSSSFGKIK